MADVGLLPVATHRHRGPGAAPSLPADEVGRTATRLAAQAREAGLDGETVLAIVRAALAAAR